MAALPYLRNSISCLAALGLLCTFSSAAFGVVILDPDQDLTLTPPTTSPAFPWQNLGFIGNASTIFIGDVANNNTYWAISAEHNGNPGTLEFNGISYDVIHSQVLENPSGTSGTPDLRLFQLNVTSLPNGLINLKLPTSLVSSSTLLYMMGVGDIDGDRDQKRWGTNHADVYYGPSIRSIPISDDYHTTLGFAVQTSLSATSPSMEGRGVAGDSGGGVLYNNGIDWYLAGIMFGIGQDGDTYYTYAANIASYTPQIGHIAAIPEPGTLVLIGLGAAGLLRVRRRSRS